MSEKKVDNLLIVLESFTAVFLEMGSVTRGFDARLPSLMRAWLVEATYLMAAVCLAS